MPRCQSRNFTVEQTLELLARIQASPEESARVPEGEPEPGLHISQHGNQRLLLSLFRSNTFVLVDDKLLYFRHNEPVTRTW